jgi:pseudaminic acid biosynthesis-associated methylase
MTTAYKTEQEEFWAGKFGSEYITRNSNAHLLASNLNFFSNIFKRVGKINSCIEFGANVGMNLQAIKLLFPDIDLKAIEINPDATKVLDKLIGEDNVYKGSIFDYTALDYADVSLIKGVLIHINPNMLDVVYQKLYETSSRYILLCEYYSSFPVAIPYRGHNDKLFKRDFAGEMLDKYPDLKLVDYGFSYIKDPAFPQDDITWFLMQKS